MDPGFDTVLVVDFGAQYAQLIARRVREAGVYSEIVPHSITAAELAERAPAGDLQRRPKSVHVPGAPVIDAVYDPIPILGICYGAQLWPSSSAARSNRRGGAVRAHELTVTGEHGPARPRPTGPAGG